LIGLSQTSASAKAEAYLVRQPAMRPLKRGAAARINETLTARLAGPDGLKETLALDP